MEQEQELVIPDPWECIQCGMCCKRYDPDKNTIVRCQYLKDDDQCSIYEDRPIACRLDYMSDALKTTHCNISISSIQNRISQEDLINLIRHNQDKEKPLQSEQGEFDSVPGEL